MRLGIRAAWFPSSTGQCYPFHCVAVGFSEVGEATREDAAALAVATIERLGAVRGSPNGFLVHWPDADGTAAADEEVSTVDTAIAALGAAFAGRYFGGTVAARADAFLRRV